MSGMRGALLVPALAAAIASVAGAQWSGDVHTFTGAALLVGAQGFARPPLTSAVVAGYAHTPVRAVLVGAQVAATFAESRESHAEYAVATVAYAQRRALGLQIYPYLAAGAAALRTRPRDPQWRPAFGAGFGIDLLTTSASRGAMLGARVGYLTRSLGDDESVAYAAIGFGFGARKTQRDEPRAIVAR